jgi:ribosomal protein L12E/L44/L45/RPP1/RPP2
MSSTNLKLAGTQAQLNPNEKKQIDALSNLLDTHKSLLDLPAAQAKQKYGQLPADQQSALVAFNGEEAGKKRGWWGSAWHYTGGAALSGLQEASDFVTRLYRLGKVGTQLEAAQPGNQLKGLSGLKTAWDAAGDKGDLVYDPTRIEKAKIKYTPDRVSVAVKAASGIPLDEIIATGTEAEKQIAAKASKKQDPLFQDTYDAVVAAKYSPGRELANAILPESLEGTGFLYKGISGVGDAAFRWYTDPTLILGKAKQAYDAANYALLKIVGDPKKLDAAFTNPKVVGFFNQYGKELDNLASARSARNITAATEASTRLKRIAPEFGPSAIDEFIKAGVKDAPTAKNYLANIVDVKTILTGQPARKTPLIPRLDAARKARIAIYTGADKVFNIDKSGRKIIAALYGTEPQYADIAIGLTNDPAKIAGYESFISKFKGPTGSIRMPLDVIQGRIDRFAAKFTTIPYFKDGFFDVMSPTAATQVYRVARLANSRYHSKMIAEAFDAGSEGQRKQIFTGLWNTVAEIRGVSKTKAGASYMDQFAGRGLEKKYAADIVVDGVNKGNPAQFGEQQLALFPYQLSSGIAVPSVTDLDRLSVRSGIIGTIMGLSHQRWVDKTLSLWVIGTLAGPRFAIRNATEDLMMHLAVGDSAFGIVKGRALSTRIRLSKGLTAEDKLTQVGKKAITLDLQAGEVGVLNKLVRRKDLKKYAAKVSVAQTPQEVRQVMADAILHDGLGHVVDKKGSEYLAEIAKYGNLDDTLRAITEGGKNGLRGLDQYLVATNDAAQFGKMAAIEIDGVAYKQAMGDKAFTQFNPVANQQNRISWLVQLGVTSNDDLAKIAVANLDNEPKALEAMREYLRNLSPRERARFQLYDESVGGNINVHAKKAYDAVRNLYSKRNGEINMDLLDKVRFVDKKGNVVVSTKNLSLEDLPNKMSVELTPEFISGPTLVPVSDTGNFAVSLTDKAWDAMGEANARFSREPIVINEMIRIRKEMAESGFEERLVEAFTQGLDGDDLQFALTNAKKEIVAITEELAKNRVLAFVDNPAVRSQLAMASRNFARFYRATEDFYRRVYRTVRYNPESIRRLSLTYEGVTHSGFVQQDDNGEPYFFYPGLTPVYKVMSDVAQYFGAPEAFQAPMPVEFGGKLKMLTPSMNPDSLFPTFAGPIAAIPLKFIFNAVPALDTFEKVALGAYAEDQPMINAIFPAHVSRFIAALDKNERRSQYASAFRKAATYLEATGHGVKPTFDPETGQWIPPSPAELQNYKDKIGATTVNVLAMRFLFGFFAPASPQVTLKSEMAEWARANKRVNFKQVFNNLITQNKGSLDAAMEDWIRLFPDQMPYTVSESDDNVVPVVRAVDKTVGWIDKNKNLLKSYPAAAPFLMPKEGDFDFDAYRLLFKSGIKFSKTLDDHLQDIQSSRDIQFYYQQKDSYEEELAGTFGDAQKTQLKNMWDAWSTQFKGARPVLQAELGQGAERQRARQTAYQDLQNMILGPESQLARKSDPAAFDSLKKMSEIYDNYVYSRDLVVGSSATASAYKDLLKQNAKFALQEIASKNPNAEDAYNVLFSRLIGD